MLFENTEVFNFDGALRGMRNPKESWNKSDSEWETHINYNKDEVYTKFSIGKNDLKLAQTLIRAGNEHRKFMRQIFVSVDITAPLYWWKEFDTYKVAIVSNSCSTMHKLADTPITLNCFEMDDFSIFETNSNDNEKSMNSFEFWNLYQIPYLEKLRVLFNETKNKRYWKELIRLLPESWLQKRTITLTYENLLNIYRQRKNHKLTEWSKSFCDWVKTLPYAEELICLE